MGLARPSRLALDGLEGHPPAGFLRRTMHIHFVTGRLAEYSLRKLLAELAPTVGFDYTIEVLGITVAALMTTEWVAKRIHVPQNADRVVLPGYCSGDVAVVQRVTNVPIERGPKDLRELPRWFGQPPADDYGHYNIEILAEINYAPRLTPDEIVRQAADMEAQGADVIDLGCNPGETWSGAADVVRRLRDEGYRVSIDSLNPAEIAPAAAAGAELVLSVNSTNREQAADWGCEVVAVPDVPATLAGLEETIDCLAASGVPLRIDPVIEPIGFGFARSLGRYLTVRDRYPDAEMMMGVGNLTELTDVDSAGVNVLLLGFCQEVGIRSILTTQVIHWARTSVRECDLARRLAYYAVERRSLPKHVEPRLVMLRDPQVLAFGGDELERLAGSLKDENFRIFAEGGRLHVIAAGLHLAGDDPFDLFDQLQASGRGRLDLGHAFYLGYEMAKAVTSLTLGKQYRQDQALEWGFLTQPERSHRAN